MLVYGLGNTFSGNAKAAEQVAPRTHVSRPLLEKRLDVARRAYTLNAAGKWDEGEAIERFMYRIHHCGSMEGYDGNL